MALVLQDTLIDAIPPAAAPARARAASRLIRWAGELVEDLGPNSGRALNRIALDPYRQVRGVGRGVDLPWCIVVGCLAWRAATGDRWSRDPAVWAAERATWAAPDWPFSTWLGAAREVEAEARSVPGMWVPRSQLGALAPGVITGAFLIRERRGSRSDAASGRGRLWPGHGDLAIRLERRGGRLGVLGVGGNLDDEVDAVWRPLDDSRFHGAALFPVAA